MIRITTKQQLLDLTIKLKTRPDWHEPDEQDLTAKVFGTCLDNAGFWADDRSRYYEGDYEELHAVLYQRGTPIAAVNLATLFAWATGLDR